MVSITSLLRLGILITGEDPFKWTYQILELFLFLLLQLLQLSKLLLSEVVFVVKTLIFVITVDDFRRCCRHNDAVNFKLPRPLSRLLLQVHLLNVVPREWRLPLDRRSDDAILFLLFLLLLPVPVSLLVQFPVSVLFSFFLFSFFTLFFCLDCSLAPAVSVEWSKYFCRALALHIPGKTSKSF